MPTNLYRHFDAGGRLLYVGISVNALARLAGHKSNSEWFSQIATVTVEHFSRRRDAEKAERRAIREEKPEHNRMRYKRKKPRKMKPPKQALQKASTIHQQPSRKADAKTYFCMGPHLPDPLWPPKPWFWRATAIAPDGMYHSEVRPERTYRPDQIDRAVRVVREGDPMFIHPDVDMPSDKIDTLHGWGVYIMPEGCGLSDNPAWASEPVTHDVL